MIKYLIRKSSNYITSEINLQSNPIGVRIESRKSNRRKEVNSCQWWSNYEINLLHRSKKTYYFFIASFQMTWMTLKLYKTLDDVDGVDLQLVIKLAKRTSPTHPIYNAMQKPNPSWTGILQRVSSWNVNQWSRLRPQTHWLNNEWINESVNDARRRPKPMMMASESGASSTFWINDGRVFPLMQLIQTRLWKKKKNQK